MRLGRFWRATLTVLGGSLAAQAWPMLAAPIITRLCGPEDVGAFSVWFGVAAIASVAATLRLEHAMVLEPRRSRQRVCFGTVAWSASWLALLLTAGCALARMLGWEALSWAGVASVGLAAWLMAAMQTMLGYATSHAAFAAAARARVCAAAAIALAQVGLLAAGAGAPALLAGHLAGSAAGLLAARYLLHPPLPRVLSWRPWAARAGGSGPGRGAAAEPSAMPAIAVARATRTGSVQAAAPRSPAAGEVWAAKPGAAGRRPPLTSWPSSAARCLRRLMLPSAAQRSYLARHQGFWRYALVSGLLNAAVSQLPVLLIAGRHGAVAAGLLALTQRVLGAPVGLLAASVLEVFKRESVQQYRQHGHCRPAYRQALRALLLLGFPPLLLLLAAAPALFGWAFGPQWREGGELARLLAPLYYLNFVAGPLSYVFYIAGQQRAELLWQVALFAMTAAVFLAPLTLRQAVLAYAAGYSLLYLRYLQLSYRYAGPAGKPGRRHAAG